MPFVLSYNYDHKINGVCGNTYDREDNPAPFLFHGYPVENVEQAYQASKLFFCVDHERPSHKINPENGFDLRTGIQTFEDAIKYKRPLDKYPGQRVNMQQILGAGKVTNPDFFPDTQSSLVRAQIESGDLSNYFPAEVMTQLIMMKLTQNPALYFKIKASTGGKFEELYCFENAIRTDGTIRDRINGCHYDEKTNRVVEGMNIQGRCFKEALLRIRDREIEFGKVAEIRNFYINGPLTLKILNASNTAHRPNKEPAPSLSKWKDNHHSRSIVLNVANVSSAPSKPPHSKATDRIHDGSVSSPVAPPAPAKRLTDAPKDIAQRIIQQQYSDSLSSADTSLRGVITAAPKFNDSPINVDGATAEKVKRKIFISCPPVEFEKDNNGDGDFARAMVKCLASNGEKVEFIKGSTQLSGNDLYGHIPSLKKLADKGRSSSDTYNDYLKVKEDPLRKQAVENVFKYIKQNTPTDEESVLHLNIRPPETGFLFMPEDLQRFRNEGIKVVLTIHEYKLNQHAGRKNLQEYVHYYAEKADHVVFLNRKDRDNAIKDADELRGIMRPGNPLRRLFVDKTEELPKYNLEAKSSLSAVPPTTAVTRQTVDERLVRPSSIAVFGTFRPNKGFEEAITLAKMLHNKKTVGTAEEKKIFKDSKVYFVGNPADKKLTDLIEKASRDCPNSVEIIKNANDAQVLDVYKKCKYVYRPDNKGFANNASGIIAPLANGCITFAKWGFDTDDRFLPERGSKGTKGVRPAGKFYGALVLTSDKKSDLKVGYPKPEDVLSEIFDREKDRSQSANRITMKLADKALDEIFNPNVIAAQNIQAYDKVFRARATESSYPAKAKIEDIESEADKTSLSIIRLQSEKHTEYFLRDPFNLEAIKNHHGEGFDWWIFPSYSNRESVAGKPYSVNKETPLGKKVYEKLANDLNYTRIYKHCLETYFYACGWDVKTGAFYDGYNAENLFKSYPIRFDKLVESFIGMTDGNNRLLQYFEGQVEQNDFFRNIKKFADLTKQHGSDKYYQAHHKTLGDIVEKLLSKEDADDLDPPQTLDANLFDKEVKIKLEESPLTAAQKEAENQQRIQRQKLQQEQLEQLELRSLEQERLKKGFQEKLQQEQLEQLKLRRLEQERSKKEFQEKLQQYKSKQWSYQSGEVELTPGTTVEMLMASPLSGSVNIGSYKGISIWDGDKRDNKFRIFGDTYSAQDIVTSAFGDIMIAAAIDCKMSKEEAIEAFILAKERGGIFNKKSGDGYKSDNAVIKKFQDFSVTCQNYAQKCGLFTGRDEGSNLRQPLVGCRLTFFPATALDYFTKKDLRGSGEEAKENIRKISYTVSLALESRGR